jgi:hypothetical protein
MHTYLVALFHLDLFRYAPVLVRLVDIQDGTRSV